MVFRTDFDGGLIPACTNEQVAFSGTVQFVFQEVNGHETVHVQYVNVKVVGVETATQYVVPEHDKYVTILNNDNGDITFESSISGNFISSGHGINTVIQIKLNPGDIDTIVDQAKVKSPPEGTTKS